MIPNGVTPTELTLRSEPYGYFGRGSVGYLTDAVLTWPLRNLHQSGHKPTKGIFAWVTLGLLTVERRKTVV